MKLDPADTAIGAHQRVLIFLVLTLPVAVPLAIWVYTLFNPEPPEQ